MAESKTRVRYRSEAGLTLVELIIVVAMVAILASAVLPLAKLEVKRRKEQELRQDLWEMRTAIDNYKDAADKGGIQTKADSNNYPPDLETLVNGVDIQRPPRSVSARDSNRSDDEDRRIGVCDRTRMRPDSDSFGGQNVYDVYSKSDGTGLDGTKYNTW